MFTHHSESTAREANQKVSVLIFCRRCAEDGEQLLLLHTAVLLQQPLLPLSRGRSKLEGWELALKEAVLARALVECLFPAVPPAVRHRHLAGAIGFGYFLCRSLWRAAFSSIDLDDMRAGEFTEKAYSSRRSDLAALIARPAAGRDRAEPPLPGVGARRRRRRRVQVCQHPETQAARTDTTAQADWEHASSQSVRMPPPAARHRPGRARGPAPPPVCSARSAHRRARPPSHPPRRAAAPPRRSLRMCLRRARRLLRPKRIQPCGALFRAAHCSAPIL